jgi:hypothetical protein
MKPEVEENGLAEALLLARDIFYFSSAFKGRAI